MSKKYVFFFLLAVAFGLGIFWLTTDRQARSAAAACQTPEFSEIFSPEERLAYFDGKEVPVPGEIVALLAQKPKPVLGTVSGEERWVEVDLSDQKLIAHDGPNTFLETLVSTGLPWWPTPTGEFRVWAKFRATKMEGGSGRYYYYLPNVPYVMFFENAQVPGRRGYSLHGTYWHNDFGTRRSHGCVNLPTPIAEKLFSWVDKGTRVVVHD